MVNNWINDKFPKHKQRVIVVTNSGDVFDDHFYNAKTCQFVKHGEHTPTTGVTHWQPLPHPPMESHEVKDLQECLSNLCTAYRMVVGLDGAYDTPLTDAERLLKRLSERYYE